MSEYGRLERIRRARMCEAKRYLGEYRRGERSRRSIAALLRPEGRLSRVPDWIEDEEGYAVCAAAGDWLREQLDAPDERPEPTLTDAMERHGAVSPEEAARRREMARHRHEDTEYDDLLRRGIDRDTARIMI
jgi:hypothetical protein